MFVATSKQRGFSLVELMVGLLVGLIVISGAMAIFVTSLRGGNESLRASKLNQEVRSALQLMSSELAKVGYGQATASSMRLFTQSGSSPDCVIFSYNQDDASNNVFGFRWRRESNGDGISRVEYLSVATFDFAGATACPTAGWISLTNSDVVNITRLEFSSANSWCVSMSSPVAAVSNFCSGTVAVNRLEMRRVDITIEARHKADANVRINEVRTVKIRNDREILSGQNA